MARAHLPVLASGIYAALLTPRKPDTPDADAAALLDYVDCAIQAGVDGIVLFGATGEFIHFGLEERTRAAGLAIRRSRVPVLVNVSHSTLAGTVDLAESAMRVDAAGILVMPPYFYRHSQEDILAFYQKVCEILDGQIPIYLYNLPAFTNYLSIELISELLKLRGVAGIKDSSGDWQLLTGLQEMHRSFSFQLLAGQERLFVEARMAGANGTVSGVSAALPELLVALDRAILDNQKDRVALLKQRLDDYVRRVDGLPPVVAIRETAAFRGWIQNEPALPHSPATQTKIVELQSWLSGWLPETLAACPGVQGRK